MVKNRLYIVLTRTDTFLSRLIGIFKKDQYTHAAISLDSDLDQMYSFGRRNTYNPFIGCFRREDIHEGVYGLCKTLPGAIIEFEVTAQQYKKAKELMSHFVAHPDNYKYNYQGLLYGLLDKPLCAKDSFLCSEFVYYILNESGIIDLQMPRNLVRPQNLLLAEGKIVFQGDLKDLKPLNTLKPQSIIGLYLQKVIAG